MKRQRPDDRGRIETVRGDLDRPYLGTSGQRGEHDNPCDKSGGYDRHDS